MTEGERERDLSYGCDDWLRRGTREGVIEEERGKEGIDIEETFRVEQRGWQNGDR